MSIHPTFMEFGAARLISPDGSDQVPADLWPELDLLILTQPAPADLKRLTRRLEHRLGVTPAHRLALQPKPISTGRPWTVLGVAPHMERKVAETLEEAGVRVYVPIEKYKPKSDKVWKPRTRPLIPGYIFAELIDDRALDIARANDAVRLMCREGRPISVPSISIGTMIWFEGWGLFDRTKKQSGARKGCRRGRRAAGAPESRWKQGQRVKIAEGAFAGFLATILRADREDRVEVLLTIFGRETPVTLDESEIEGEGE